MDTPASSAAIARKMANQPGSVQAVRSSGYGRVGTSSADTVADSRRARLTFRGAGGRAVIGRAWTIQVVPPAWAHSMSWGLPLWSAIRTPVRAGAVAGGPPRGAPLVAWGPPFGAGAPPPGPPRRGHPRRGRGGRCSGGRLGGPPPAGRSPDDHLLPARPPLPHPAPVVEEH